MPQRASSPLMVHPRRSFVCSIWQMSRIIQITIHNIALRATFDSRHIAINMRQSNILRGRDARYWNNCRSRDLCANVSDSLFAWKINSLLKYFQFFYFKGIMVLCKQNQKVLQQQLPFQFILISKASVWTRFLHEAVILFCSLPVTVNPHHGVYFGIILWGVCVVSWEN